MRAWRKIQQGIVIKDVQLCWKLGWYTWPNTGCANLYEKWENFRWYASVIMKTVWKIKTKWNSKSQITFYIQSTLSEFKKKDRCKCSHNAIEWWVLFSVFYHTLQKCSKFQMFWVLYAAPTHYHLKCTQKIISFTCSVFGVCAFVSMFAKRTLVRASVVWNGFVVVVVAMACPCVRMYVANTQQIVVFPFIGSDKVPSLFVDFFFTVLDCGRHTLQMGIKASNKTRI